jgi:hypothetical protein
VSPDLLPVHVHTASACGEPPYPGASQWLTQLDNERTAPSALDQLVLPVCQPVRQPHSLQVEWQAAVPSPHTSPNSCAID